MLNFALATNPWPSTNFLLKNGREINLLRYFVTGHTGFKGSWLIALLKAKGHTISGYSIPAESGGLFAEAKMEQDLEQHTIGDVRDLENLKQSLEIAKPDVVIHLAAQPLVLRSYEDPVETYSTNVDGTLNLLQAVTDLKTQPVTLVVTTDKVYRDTGKGSYREDDALGGYDPYSASKAMADILTQSWAATHPELRLHIARAGNVIGAYDVSKDRLLPDIRRAIEANHPLIIRNPGAVRPWQHVLDCLNGYLMFVEAALRGEAVPIALNFGPDLEGIKTVSDVLTVAVEVHESFGFNLLELPSPKETDLLTLNSDHARELLGWTNTINFVDSVKMSLTSPSKFIREPFLETIQNFQRAL
jgi:CDP-glucose 4,6-dehydratase